MACRGWLGQVAACRGNARQGFIKSIVSDAMNFEKSNDTKILESVLEGASVGDLVTYEELSKAIGRDVRKFAQPSLCSARRGLLNAKRIVFGCETGVGLKRLNDEEIVHSSESDRRRMKRAATRAIKKLAVVNFEGLSEELKRQHVVASAQLGAIEMFSGKNATKKIESKVDGSKTTLAIGETLQMFG